MSNLQVEYHKSIIINANNRIVHAVGVMQSNAAVTDKTIDKQKREINLNFFSIFSPLF